jgi:hypothetical protein
MLYLQTPVCFPKGSPAAWQWIEWFEVQLKAAQLLEDYRASLCMVEKAVASYGLHVAVQDAVVFSPIPYWTCTYGLRKHESPHWDVVAIESRCISVNNYWQSQKQSTEKVLGDGSRIQRGSLWEKLVTMSPTRASEPHAKRRRLQEETKFEVPEEALAPISKVKQEAEAPCSQVNQEAEAPLSKQQAEAQPSKAKQEGEAGGRG